MGQTDGREKKPKVRIQSLCRGEAVKVKEKCVERSDGKYLTFCDERKRGGKSL